MFVYNKKSAYLHKENCGYVKQMHKEHKFFTDYVFLKYSKNSPTKVKFCSFCLPDGLETHNRLENKKEEKYRKQMKGI